jgi:hypothetical protein
MKMNSIPRRALPALFLLLSPVLFSPTQAQERPEKNAAKRAHPDQPVLQTEHAALLDLVSDPRATHRSARSGRWGDPATWKDGQVPSADSRVVIAQGQTVTLDEILLPAIRTIRVDGLLRFAPDQDSSLRVDTLVVAPGGRLEVGTSEHPVLAEKAAKIVFADVGPIDAAWDPFLLSRGLISHGSVTMAGAKTTPFLPLAKAPRKGDSMLLLSETPLHWKKGDRLLLAGTRLSRDGEDEERAILSISGREVGVAPLAYDHRVPKEGLAVYVGHLTRNVVLASENTSEIARFGHVMFMHSPDVDLQGVAFVRLGRTDKRKPVDDPKVDPDGRRVPGTGQNPRGRYAVHFHRTGSNPDRAAARVRDCVVESGPGWGFLNHSSFVDFEDNVAYNVNGAAFVTEAGDEIGSFRHNLAIRSAGSGHDVVARTKIQDFAHEGDGFWFQGGGVVVEDNVAAGHRSAGFIYFTQGLDQEGLGVTRFKASNLKDASWARGEEWVDVGEVPVRSFRNNVAFASDVGIIVRFHLGGSKKGGPTHPGASVLEDSVVWNARQGVSLRYSSKVTLRNLQLIGDPAEKYTQVGAMGQLEGMRALRFENLRVEGWPVGLDVRESGDHVIDGGTYRNRVNIRILTAIEKQRDVDLRGDIRFAALDDGSGQGGEDIRLEAQFGLLLQGTTGYRDPNLLFVPNIVRYQGKQLYFPEQALDYVPFRKDADRSSKGMGTAAGSVPDELLGKTNRELFEKYGLAVAGAVCPGDAASLPRVRGLLGSPSRYPRDFYHESRTAQLQGYRVRLGYVEEGKKLAIESEPRDLEKGWNLITMEVLGWKRSYLVCAGVTAAPLKTSKP